MKSFIADNFSMNSQSSIKKTTSLNFPGYKAYPHTIIQWLKAYRYCLKKE